MKKIFSEEIIFPLKIYKAIYPLNTSSIIDFLYLHKSKNGGRVISNQGGWQCELPLNEPTLHPFINALEYLGKEIFNHEIKIDEIWGNISSKNHHNTPHSHGYIPFPTGHDNLIKYSGVLYLKAPPGSGGIRFFDLHQMFNYSESYLPQEKEIIIFPNHLVHGVDTNLINEDRISIAFNITVMRESFKQFLKTQKPKYTNNTPQLYTPPTP